MQWERHKNVSEVLPFRKKVAPGESGYLDISLVAHGYITGVKITFASGENATLQVRPVVIIPRDILLDLFRYPDNGEQYICGDDETFNASLQREIENHSIARVYFKNTGIEGTADSFLNVDYTVEYFEIVEPQNIIG